MDADPPRPAWNRLVVGTALAAAAASVLCQWLRCWSVSPDPGAGWLAAALAAYLLLKRRRDRPAPAPWRPPRWSWIPVGAALAGVALVRLFLEPFPGWPLADWSYTLGLAGLALWLIALSRGPAAARHFAFPLLFGLAALPWPAAVTQGIVTPLRGVLARLAAECSALLGEPALAQGTTIRLAHATIGIEEACGGIRSLQVALILSLAAGELRRDGWRRRLGWVAGGAAVSLAANAGRLCALTFIAGGASPQGIARWHDRADWLEFALLLAGLGLLWIAFPAAGRAGAAEKGARASRPCVEASAGGTASLLSSALLAVLAFSEAGTRLWFREGGSPDADAAWSARLPRELPSYRDDPFTPGVQSLLGCDAHQVGHWLSPRGERRAGSVIEWDRGQQARFTLLLHNPDVCVPAGGGTLVASRPPLVVRLGGADLPFERREFAVGAETFQLYFLIWNLTTGRPFGAAGEIPRPGESWFLTQWREVAGRRLNLRVRAVALAVYDAGGPADADQAFLAEAPGILSRVP